MAILAARFFFMITLRNVSLIKDIVPLTPSEPQDLKALHKAEGFMVVILNIKVEVAEKH